MNTPADGGAGVEQRQQHVGAARVADAGLGGRETHAGDRRHVGHVLRGERGDGGGHGSPLRHGRLVPAIRGFDAAAVQKTPMAGTRPAMTNIV